MNPRPAKLNLGEQAVLRLFQPYTKTGKKRYDRQLLHITAFC